VTEKKTDDKKERFQAKTFPVPLALTKNKENFIVNTISDSSKQKLANQAFKYHSEGNIKEAKIYYQYFINQGFNDHKVYSNYGNILNDIGNLKEAELCYRKAIELKPNFSIAYLNLGNLLKKIGNLQEAISSISKAIELKPDFAEAYSILGVILKDLGNLLDAESLQRKAIKFNPDFAEAYSNLGNILMDLGNLEEAQQSLIKAIKLRQDLPEAHNNLGIVFRKLDKLKEAKSSYEKAIKLKPDFANAHLNLGNTFKDYGNLKEAKFHILKAIKLKPNFAEAFHSLSILFSSDKQYDKAYETIKRAINIDSDNHIFQGELTRLKFITGKYDEEIKSNELPWSDQDDYYFEDNNKDILLVIFGSMGRDEKLIPSFNFYNLLKNNHSYDKLFFRDIDRNYYLTGLKNSTSNLEETIDLIREKSSVKKYRRIISIGASSGGFASILYGHLLEFSKAIAFNPQTVLSKEKETEINDNLYTLGLCRKLRSLNLSNNLYQKCLNLKNLIPFKTQAEIHYSNLSEIDKNHAEFIEHKNCKLIKYSTSTHLLALQLRDSGELEDIIEKSLEI
tara:strand:+ start:662 stop:2353 length:1692 start_codon:yes stop_codon:yes gene_type:complete